MVTKGKTEGERCLGDLTAIASSLIKAWQALQAIDPQLKRTDRITAQLVGQAFDAVVTAHTIAILLIRELPISFFRKEG
mgnify:CR=1 FL=1